MQLGSARIDDNTYFNDMFNFFQMFQFQRVAVTLEIWLKQRLDP